MPGACPPVAHSWILHSSGLFGPCHGILNSLGLKEPPRKDFCSMPWFADARIFPPETSPSNSSKHHGTNFGRLSDKLIQNNTSSYMEDFSMAWKQPTSLSRFQQGRRGERFSGLRTSARREVAGLEYVSHSPNTVEQMLSSSRLGEENSRSASNTGADVRPWTA